MVHFRPVPVDRLDRLPHRAARGTAALEAPRPCSRGAAVLARPRRGFCGPAQAGYWLGGARYDFGAFFPNFRYELAKDALSYALFVSAFALVEHLLRQKVLIDTPGQTLSFDIRDGSNLTRVRLNQVLAIGSAGNYVEFVLNDRRRLLMRSSLSALENELGARGFVRTHRSWLVNVGQMTGLKPDGSGDYTVELGSVTVPLSRRFPEALARLRKG